MKTLPIFASALLAAIFSVRAHLPADAKSFAIEVAAFAALLVEHHATAEDDGCGLVTVTVPLRLGETWEEAAARAKLIGDRWKRHHRETKIDVETWARDESKSGAPVVVRHLLSYQDCAARPNLPLPPLRPKP